MKIIFFGTPEFAVPSLKILDENYDVVSVVTAPDKERGRGRKVSFTAVKEFAIEKSIPILQPGKMKDAEFIENLKKLNADLFVIVAFRILPNEVFTIPQKGAFNLHGSLLPKYRGAAPIQWAIINGETETGLTTFFLKEKVDTGNMILQEKILILPEDNLGTMHDKMMTFGAELVLKTVKLIENGSVEKREQDNSLTSPAPKITKELCKINWEEPAGKIHNLIRGLSPFPAAFFNHSGKTYKIYRSLINSVHNLKPEEILQTKDKLFIGCRENAIEILELQPEGRKRMDTPSFLRGYSLK